MSVGPGRERASGRETDLRSTGDGRPRPRSRGTVYATQVVTNRVTNVCVWGWSVVRLWVWDSSHRTLTPSTPHEVLSGPRSTTVKTKRKGFSRRVPGRNETRNTHAHTQTRSPKRNLDLRTYEQTYTSVRIRIPTLYTCLCKDKHIRTRTHVHTHVDTC